MNRRKRQNDSMGMFNGFRCPKMGAIKDISVCITHQARQPEDCKGCAYTKGDMLGTLINKGKEVKNDRTNKYQ